MKDKGYKVLNMCLPCESGATNDCHGRQREWGRKGTWPETLEVGVGRRLSDNRTFSAVTSGEDAESWAECAVSRDKFQAASSVRKLVQCGEALPSLCGACEPAALRLQVRRQDLAHTWSWLLEGRTQKPFARRWSRGGDWLLGYPTARLKGETGLWEQPRYSRSQLTVDQATRWGARQDAWLNVCAWAFLWLGHPCFRG